MKKIVLAVIALSLVSGISYASDGGKKKNKKQKTECGKKCIEKKCCTKNC